MEVWSAPPVCTNSAFLNKFSGVSGDLDYCIGNGSGVMIPISGTLVGSTCTIAEVTKTKKVGNDLWTCNGSDWQNISTCPATSFTCFTSGKVVGSDVGPIQCNGVNWLTLDSSCPALDCPTFLDPLSCDESAFRCHWVSNSCIDAVAYCAAVVGGAGVCNATTPCSWSSNSCSPAY